MNQYRHSLIRKSILLFLLPPLQCLAIEDAQALKDPNNAVHSGTTPSKAPLDTSGPGAPDKGTAEAAPGEEHSGKGLIVNRAPDFCMKKDPPPHCTE